VHVHFGLEAVGTASQGCERQAGGTKQDKQWETAHGGGLRIRVKPAFQRFSLLRPACTILATELTIIERASQASPRAWSSAAITRSAAVGACGKEASELVTARERAACQGAV